MPGKWDWPDGAVRIRLESLRPGFLIAAFQSIGFVYSVNWLEFANLVLVGIILNLVFLRTGTPLGCMGLHAGWTVARNFLSKTMEVPDSPATRFWGSGRIVDGAACLIMLVILTIVLHVEFRRHHPKGRLSLDGRA